MVICKEFKLYEIFFNIKMSKNNFIYYDLEYILNMGVQTVWVTATHIV